MNNRERVRRNRHLAAKEMASFVCEPDEHGEFPEDAYSKARSLLNRCTRWAIAQMRHDESETASNWNKPWYVKEGKRLDARYEKLQAELAEYGCSIECLGYTCQNVYRLDERGLPVGWGLLYFFD